MPSPEAFYLRRPYKIRPFRNQERVACRALPRTSNIIAPLTAVHERINLFSCFVVVSCSSLSCPASEVDPFANYLFVGREASSLAASGACSMSATPLSVATCGSP